MQSMKTSIQRGSAIRTILVDSSLECLAGLEKWLGTLPILEIVGKVGTGVEAVEQCRALHPDLVLMDVVLPVMNGYDATARIKEGGHCPRIILMSFFDVGEAYGNGDQFKADAILNKDALYQELIPLVTRLFPCVTRIAEGGRINVRHETGL